MSVNGYQSTLQFMLTKCNQASLVPWPLPAFRCLQYGKDFTFACGESLGKAISSYMRKKQSVQRSKSSTCWQLQA